MPTKATRAPQTHQKQKTDFTLLSSPPELHQVAAPCDRGPAPIVSARIRSAHSRCAFPARPSSRGPRTVRDPAATETIFVVSSRYVYKVPALTIGVTSPSPHSTTSKLLTIAALRSLSSSTTLLLARSSRAICTMLTAPCTIF